MNEDEDHLFSDEFDVPEDKNDKDYSPTDTSEMSGMSTDADSPKNKVGLF